MAVFVESVAENQPRAKLLEELEGEIYQGQESWSEQKKYEVNKRKKQVFLELEMILNIREWKNEKKCGKKRK